jgi:predicted AAA+ superfamily ATPase
MHANVSKRLVKAPKVYVRDSGLVHALLGLETPDRLAGHPVVGASWEGYVIETLLSVMPWNHHAFFYRTVVGAEIDLVIEHPDGRLWAIEIKRSASVRPGRGFHQALDDIKPARSFIVHAGPDRWPIAADVESIGLRAMALEIAALN